MAHNVQQPYLIGLDERDILTAVSMCTEATSKRLRLSVWNQPMLLKMRSVTAACGHMSYRKMAKLLSSRTPCVARSSHQLLTLKQASAGTSRMKACYRDLADSKERYSELTLEVTDQCCSHIFADGSDLKYGYQSAGAEAVCRARLQHGGGSKAFGPNDGL